MCHFEHDNKLTAKLDENGSKPVNNVCKKCRPVR